MKNILLTIFLFFLLSPILRATENWSLGGKAGGLSGASTTFADVWSLRNNQAGIAQLNGLHAGIYVDNRFLVQEFTVKGAALAYGFEKSGIGVDVSSFGYSQYNENKVGLSYAMLLSEKISVGVQLNYFQVAFGSSYGSGGNVTGEVGFRAELTDVVTLGVHLANPTRSQLTTVYDERIPTILRTGAQFDLSEELTTVVEIEKNMTQPFNIKAGAEYNIRDLFFVRLGGQSYRRSLSFGFGIVQDKWSVNLASQYDPFLGLSPKIGFQLHPKGIGK